MYKRPEFLYGITRKYTTGCGQMYITLNYTEDNKLVELFAQLGKSGGCSRSQCEGIARLVSMALQGNIPTEDIVKQLAGIRCHGATSHMTNTRGCESCCDAIAHALKDTKQTKFEKPVEIVTQPKTCSGI